MPAVAVVYDNSNSNSGPIPQCNAIDPQGKFQKIYANSDAKGTPNSNIANDIKTFATKNPGGGLIVTGCTLTGLLREDITTAALQNNLIAIFPEQMYNRRTTSLGLMSYGPDLLALYTQVATNCIKPVLGGASPSSVAITTAQPPYPLIINQHIATRLRLTIPATFSVISNGVKQQITPIIDP
jgi:hypothetical protein